MLISRGSNHAASMAATPYSGQALGRMQRIKLFLSNGSQNRELDQCQQNHGLTKSPLTAAIPRLSSGLATEVSSQVTSPAPVKLVALQWSRSSAPGTETIVSCRVPACATT
jgi:hypothetical protein